MSNLHLSPETKFTLNLNSLIVNDRYAVMGKSHSRLGFKSLFEHFWGVIRQFKDSIRKLTIGIRFDLVFFCDSIWTMRFDS